MVAVPAASPTTKPLPFTAAIDGALLAQVTVRPVSALPLASFGVAVSCAVPFVGIVAGLGVPSTEATGRGVTDTIALPLLPSPVAGIGADPAAIPCSSPVA